MKEARSPHSRLPLRMESLMAGAPTSQMGNLLETKANIDDVNAALAEVSAELEKKAPKAGLEDVRRAQAPSPTAPLATGIRFFPRSSIGCIIRPFATQSAPPFPPSTLSNSSLARVATAVPQLNPSHLLPHPI